LQKAPSSPKIKPPEEQVSGGIFPKLDHEQSLFLDATFSGNFCFHYTRKEEMGRSGFWSVVVFTTSINLLEVLG